MRVAREGRVLAVASGGGHWVQLMRLMPVLEGRDVAFATVRREYAADVAGARLHVVHDANLDRKLGLLRTALGVLWVVVRERPGVVLSTGAAPGWFALVFGKLLGARTVWIDSLANAERLSKSGEKAGRWADLWLTQWPEVARDGGPRYEGSVL